jgi:hypothetical protein
MVDKLQTAEAKKRRSGINHTSRNQRKLAKLLPADDWAGSKLYMMTGPKKS